MVIGEVSFLLNDNGCMWRYNKRIETGNADDLYRHKSKGAKQWKDRQDHSLAGYCGNDPWRFDLLRAWV